MVGRKQTIVVEGAHSREVDVLSGVPQGTVLGPLCFLLFINDLPDEIKKDVQESFIGLFADDTLIAREIKNEEDANILQEDLSKLQTWTEHWGMYFNAGKCELLRVTRKRKPINADYILNNVKLKRKSRDKIS